MLHAFKYHHIWQFAGEPRSSIPSLFFPLLKLIIWKRVAFQKLQAGSHTHQGKGPDICGRWHTSCTRSHILYEPFMVICPDAMFIWLFSFSFVWKKQATFVPIRISIMQIFVHSHTHNIFFLWHKRQILHPSECMNQQRVPERFRAPNLNLQLKMNISMSEGSPYNDSNGKGNIWYILAN